MVLFCDVQTETGASKHPCSETYAGPWPFSEVETESLANFIRRFDDIKIYMSFHSYGQMLLFPYVRKKEDFFAEIFFEFSFIL